MTIAVDLGRKATKQTNKLDLGSTKVALFWDIHRMPVYDQLQLKHRVKYKYLSVKKVNYDLKKVSENDQEIPQSHTANQPTAS